MAEIDYDAHNVNLVQPVNMKEPSLNLKAVGRKKERYNSWTCEEVKISVLDADGNERPGCTWRVPRHKLEIAFVQDIINRSPASQDPDGCMLEFLRDSTGVDLIWPKDMQTVREAQLHCASVILRTLPLPHSLTHSLTHSPTHTLSLQSLHCPPLPHP